MVIFENFTFFIKFFPTEAIDKQFYYYGYSKIELSQVLTKCIYHDFLCLVFLIDLLTNILIKTIFLKYYFFKQLQSALSVSHPEALDIHDLVHYIIGFLHDLPSKEEPSLKVSFSSCLRVKINQNFKILRPSWSKFKF